MSSPNEVAIRPVIAVPAIAQAASSTDGVWIMFPKERRRSWLIVRAAKWIDRRVRDTAGSCAKLVGDCWKAAKPVLVALLPTLVCGALGIVVCLLMLYSAGHVGR